MAVKPLNTATLLPGRRYTVNAAGDIATLTRRYQVLRDPRQPAAVLEVETITGLPALGEAHPANPSLTVSRYDVTEDDNGVRWVVEVEYTIPDGSASQTPEEGDDGGAVEVSRGWETQDVSADLTHDLGSGDPILNAAGDVFESVPQVPRACPVFRLVKKSNISPASRIGYSGTINAGAGTIDGVSIPKHAGRLSVAVERIYNDSGGFTWLYTYTVTLMEKIVDGANIGWDVAFLETGYYFKDSEGKKKQAVEKDEETQQSRARTVPALLNKDGTLNTSGTGVNKIVQAMPAASWTGIF